MRMNQRRRRKSTVNPDDLAVFAQPSDSEPGSNASNFAPESSLARFPAEMIHLVMAGLVPAIPTEEARPCQLNRDRRDKPGDDDSVLAESALRSACALGVRVSKHDAAAESHLPIARGRRA